MGRFKTDFRSMILDVKMVGAQKIYKTKTKQLIVSIRDGPNSPKIW